MLKDSKQVFEINTRRICPTKHLLAFEIMAVREAYMRSGINHIGLIRGEDTPTDSLKKIHDSNAFEMILDSGVDQMQIQK